jgi:subtilisin family serine protease
MRQNKFLPKMVTVAALMLAGLSLQAADRTVIVIFKNGNAVRSSSARFSSPAASLRAMTARSAAVSIVPDAKNVKDLWIVNGYALDASSASIDALSKNPDVEVLENFEVRTPEVHMENTAAKSLSMENWGLTKIGAQAAWAAFGVTGRGVRIGHLDTGVDASHPDLAGKVAAWAEFNGSGNRVYSTPHDSGIHGTHTAGTLVGGSASGAPIGVAPNAKLISGLVLNGTSGTLLQVLAGMQWVLDPDGNPATDDGAEILSMSLGAPGQYNVFQDITDRLVAAGVLPVFAVGNSGPNNADAPGNCVGAMSVGATMYSDVIAPFSGGGRVTWGGKTYVKPEITAPGYGIPSSIPGGSYQTLSGSSMATPHVAGAAALLKEANPSLTVAQIMKALTSTAVDLGAPGQDDRFGYGRLDVSAALATVTERSMVQGLAQGQGQPVPASIRVLDRDGRMVSAVRANPTTGRFEVPVAQGDYILEASYGQTRGVQKTVSVGKSSVVTVDFSFSASAGLDNLLAYPNPFRGGQDSTVTFDGLPSDTQVTVYTFSGEKVAEVSSGASGQALWNGKNASGESLAAGAYFYLASHYDAQSGWEHKKGTLAVLK